jgi:hypothetical protein
MGYIIALILILIIVPLLVKTVGKRAGGAGLDQKREENQTIRSEPAADEPSPSGASAVNQATPSGERRLPPS